MQLFQSTEIEGSAIGGVDSFSPGPWRTLNSCYLLDAPMTTSIATSTEVPVSMQLQPVQEVASFRKKVLHLTHNDWTRVRVY